MLSLWAACAGSQPSPAAAVRATAHRSALGQGRGGGMSDTGDVAVSGAAAASATAAPQATQTPSPSCAPLACRTVKRGVAVLLPLSGKFAAIGREVRAAIEAGAGAVSAAGLLAYYDTAGDAVQATHATEHALADGYGLILGPLGQFEAASVIAAAAGKAVVLHLSPLGAADAERGVVRLAFGPQDEGAWAIALAELEEYQALAIFAPGDPTGRLAAESAIAAARQRSNLEVVAHQEFVPDAKTLEAAVRELLGIVPASNAELRRHIAETGKAGIKTFVPRLDFAWLYVPASYQLGALIAAYLPYYNVEPRRDGGDDTMALRDKYRGLIPSVVQLVGPSSWASEGFLARAGEAAEGALIVAPCPGGFAPGTKSEEIEALLRGKLRRRPSELAMQAYDAAALVGEVIAYLADESHDPVSPGEYWNAETFAGVLARLGRASLADGACGPAAMTSHGILARTPSALTIRGGLIEPAYP